MRRLALAALLAALAAPPVRADNSLIIVDGAATFSSDEAGLANAYTVEERGGNIRFYDPNDLKGINAPAECEPGEIKGAAIVEVFCPRRLVPNGIALEPSSGEDAIHYAVGGISGSILGGSGADRLASLGDSKDILVGEQGNDRLDAGPGDDEVRGEDGADTLFGGDGNDSLFGGGADDKIDAGPGDDSIRDPDGNADEIACGPGTDTVVADQRDVVAGDCEQVTRQEVAAQQGVSTADDKTAPACRLGGYSRQRVGSRREVEVLVVSSEPGPVVVTGYVDAGGINTALRPAKANVPVGGGGVAIRLRLSRRAHAYVRRDLRRGREPRVHVVASAEDAAGNTSKQRRMTIRLRSSTP